jgi:hypothetical protein
MARGIKVFGWVMIAGSSGFMVALALTQGNLPLRAHWLMGIFFGGLHLAYGAYLYLTEKGKPGA